MISVKVIWQCMALALAFRVTHVFGNKCLSLGKTTDKPWKQKTKRKKKHCYCNIIGAAQLNLAAETPQRFWDLVQVRLVTCMQLHFSLGKLFVWRWGVNAVALSRIGQAKFRCPGCGRRLLSGRMTARGTWSSWLSSVTKPQAYMTKPKTKPMHHTTNTHKGIERWLFPHKIRNTKRSGASSTNKQGETKTTK